MEIALWMSPLGTSRWIFLFFCRCDSRVRLHEKKKKKKKKSCLFHLVLCKSDEMRVDPADPLKLKEQQKKQKNDRASFPDKQHRAEE